MTVIATGEDVADDGEADLVPSLARDGEETVEEVEEKVVRTRRFRQRVNGKRAGVVLAACGVLVLLLLAFVYPVASLWYHSRQEALKSAASSEGTQIGSIVPSTGQQVGVLQDPSIHLNVVIAEGTSASILRGGPGHLAGTPLPGARGNSVVYGHRDDWGGPFAHLDELKAGDKLYLQARDGVARLPETGYFIYTVSSVRTVPDTDIAPLAKSTGYELTLVTSDGSRISGNRDLVVTAISKHAANGTPTPGASKSSTPSTAPGTGGAMGQLEPGRGALVLNWEVIAAVVGAFACYRLVGRLRKNHRVITTAMVVTPVALGTVLGLLLELDLLAMRPLA